jgi:signal transduction histidine kinase
VPFHSIDDPVRLTRVLEATMLLAADVELPALLGHVIDEARFLTGARYGALGILDNDGTSIAEFLTVGLTAEEEEAIGPRPTGRGVLGLLIDDPRPLRLARLDDHPDRFGFPPNHPPMHSFLGVPINVRNEVYGSLYLTDKTDSTEFTAEDQELVEALAVAAGMAIENSRLHRRVQELAVIEDRHRMARDLHDTVIQHLYAVGISLETMAREPAAAVVADRLGLLVTDIGDAIRQVRSSIYELGLDLGDLGVRASVLTLVRSLNPMVGFDIHVSFAGPVDSVVSETVSENLLATVREAITNIARHADATTASVSIVVEDEVCRLRIIDNGCGIDGTRVGTTGMGLVNLRRRAETLHGTMAIEASDAGGTVLVWRVPVS